MKTLLTLALLLAPGLAAAKEPKLPPYLDSIRCAGLAEAAAKSEVGGIRSSKVNFSAAIFWGMAASERARKDGLTGARFTADQLAAAARADSEFKAGSKAAADELARCIARIPPDPPARKGKRR
ncbi:MAG TPA: hypothetical protein VF680_07995 [Allosphingosinicella sp.]|jgi:hypothetical protein